MGGPISAAAPAAAEPRQGSMRWEPPSEALPAFPVAARFTPAPALAGARRTPAAAQRKIGEMVGGRYRLVRPLGHGALTETWEAAHVELSRSVALKFLAPGQREVGDRMIEEARAIASVRHPHVVELSDVGRTNTGGPFFVMELLPGQTLAAILAERKTLPWARAVSIAKQVCDALTAAHRHGIVHRDLRPENVFCVETDDVGDFVKVVDFGLARADVGALGTGYMSPEQCGGGSLDPRSDVYATGCLLFAMITGDPPFVGTADAVRAAHLSATPKRLSERAPRQLISDELEAAVARCLAKDPQQRFADTRELGAELDRIARAAAAASLAGAPVARIDPDPTPAGAAPVMGYANRPAPRSARELTQSCAPIPVDPSRVRKRRQAEPVPSTGPSPLAVAGLAVALAAVMIGAGIGVYLAVTKLIVEPADAATDRVEERGAERLQPEARPKRTPRADDDPSPKPEVGGPALPAATDPRVTPGEAAQAKRSTARPNDKRDGAGAGASANPEPPPSEPEGATEPDPSEPLFPPQPDPSPTNMPDKTKGGSIDHADLLDPWG